MFRCVLLLLVSLILPFSVGYAAVKAGLSQNPSHVSEGSFDGPHEAGSSVTNSGSHLGGEKMGSGNDSNVLSVQDTIQLGLDTPQD